MTTYYKINGTYVSWQEAYNSGYTQEPSNSISYKSAASATWGDSAGTGMLLGDTTDPIAALFFLEGESGWHSMDEMASDYSVYPSDAEDVQMHNTNTGTNSDGVKLESDGVYYYLIANDLSLGWVVEDDLSDYGWEEGQPVPTLPTVSNFGFIMHNNPVTINAGNTNSDFYVGTTGQPATYDSGKLYGTISALDSIGGNKVNQTYISLVNDNGEIAVKNVSQASITIEVVTISECSSNQATVVTVYNSQNNPYNAFQYTLDGTDYYYVLDGVQTDWTDDLSSIGYHLPIPLPTVEIFADSVSGWCCTSSFPNTINLSSNNIVELYNSDRGGTVTGRSACDTSKKYSLIQWQAVQMVLEGRTEIEIESDTGYLRAKNVSNSAVTFLQARIVVCSSSDATVEMVLDVDNNRFNAFKYTLNGTDYYYVLDGTQTDWTDDLSSIGYRLPPEYIDVYLYLYYDGRACTFGSGDYWGSFIIDNGDKAALENFGISIVTVTSGTIAVTAEAVSYANNDQFTFEILGLYTGVRTGDAVADLSNFNIDRGPSNQQFYYPQNCIWSVNAYNTSVKTWKCRITKKTT